MNTDNSKATMPSVPDPIRVYLRSSAIAGCLLGASLATTVACAQERYPTRPVRLIVPSSPGGGTDTSARIVAPKLSEYLGQQVVVENRPGAAAMIGTEAVARSAPDGYTLLMGASTTVIVPSIYRKIRYDAIRDFAPISLAVVLPQILVSHPSVPARTLKELIAFVRARPGQLDYAAGSIGGNPHMSMALFLTMSGLKVTYVPYKSGNAGLIDVISGQVPLMMASQLAAMPHVRSGRLRAYGVTGMKRSSGAPDIPTIAEAGVPGYESLQWFGLLAPAGTPREIVLRLHGLTVRALQDPEVGKRFTGDGAELAPSSSPEEFAAFMRDEMAKWAKVVKEAGIEPQ